MKLHWEYGEGPADTAALAEELAREGRLIEGALIRRDGRCLWGVIENYRIVEGQLRRLRGLSTESIRLLCSFDLRTRNSDAFEGTPEQRCTEMARRMRVIPF